MKKLTDGTEVKLVLDLGEGEIVVDDPDLIPPGTDPSRSSWVPLSKYEELMEKYRTVNYEYTRLSNAWMGFAAQNRIRPEEVKIAEERGKNLFALAAKLLPFDSVKLSVLETLVKVLKARGLKAWALRNLL